MNFVQAYTAFWKNYANFNGRATRTEFWSAWVGNMLILLLIVILAVVSSGIGLVLYPLFGLATLVPNLALMVRRLHDTGRGTIQLLWILLPVLGGLYLFVVCGFIGGNPHENEFGYDPRTIAPVA